MLLLEIPALRQINICPLRRAVALLPLAPHTAAALASLLAHPGLSPRAAVHARAPRRHDHRAASRLHLARQALCVGSGRQGPEKQLPPYFLSYSVSDSSYVSIRAQYGALCPTAPPGRMRVADVQVRVGDPKLDNTHGTHRGSAVNSLQLPLGDDREALARSLWLATNTGYGNALDNYLRVKTEAQVRAKEEDTSPDFSQEAPQTYIGAVAPPVVVDRAAWEQRVRELSKVFREYPDVYQNMVLLTVQNETDYFASSEGSRIVTPHLLARLVAVAVTRADDGMDLFREQTFEAETVDGLPKQADLEAAMRELGKSLEALRKAPVTEPFDGPAILSGRAAAVFFHEVLGHRLEGQRQRGDEEGQTFTKDVGQRSAARLSLRRRRSHQ